jgi:Arc/MetJ-type ribon-helix-helix transcriptional regulator
MTAEDVAALDELVESGRFPNRSEALREGFTRLLREEREREIAEAYARGYARYPQPDWLGEAGLAALAAFDRAEGGEPL